MACEVTIGLVALVLTLVFLLYRKRKAQMRILREMGIPGPTPHWFMGDTRLMKHRLPHEMRCDLERQFGKTFSFYEGPVPVVVTSDLDMLHQVLVKNFASFTYRKEFPLQADPESELAGLILAGGARWKRLRSIVNPTFSTAKLRRISTLIHPKTDTMMKCLAEKAGEECFDILPLYQALTLDVLGSAAFGMECNTQADPQDFFLNAANKCNELVSPGEKPLVVFISELLPELKNVIMMVFLTVGKFVKMPFAILLDAIEDTMKQRAAEKEVKRYDMLQLMLDAEVDVQADESSRWTMSAQDDADTADTTTGGGKTRNKNNSLTHTEIVGQSFLFLTAGYETSSMTLSYITYLLATNPEVQDRLLEELDTHLTLSATVDYDAVQKLPYLHQVVYETLRLYPPGGDVVHRQCVTPCTIQGLQFQPGTCVMANVWSIHRDTDIWGLDADQFRPERFDAEEHSGRHPMAFLGFGAGPRNCIGLRFALMEIKMTLATMLQRYRFKEVDETRRRFAMAQSIILQPADGIHVKLVARNKP